MAAVLLTADAPELNPAVAVEALQFQGPHVRAIHVVIEGEVRDPGQEVGGLEIRDSAWGVAGGFQIQIVIPFMCLNGSRMPGMGAASVAGPVEVRRAFDDGPTAEPGFKVDDVLGGTGGEGCAEGEEEEDG